MDLMDFINYGITQNLPTKTLYFLDRNIISIIKDINSRKEIKDDDKKKFSQELRNLDCKSNIFTPIFSLFEGEHGRMESSDEISKTVEKEVEALIYFFRKADIDKSFIEENLKQSFYEAKNSPDYKANFKDKENFLKEVNHYLYQPQKDRIDAGNRIIEIQKNNYAKYFNKSHPVVIAALCCLYENNVCNKILKPKKDIENTNYYNSAMDFHHFTTFVHIRSAIEGKHSKRYNAKIHCEFLSRDKSLNEFFSWFDLNKSNSKMKNGALIANMVLNKKGLETIPREVKDILNI